jgi:hypothetical protein
VLENLLATRTGSSLCRHRKWRCVLRRLGFGLSTLCFL